MTLNPSDLDHDEWQAVRKKCCECFNLGRDEQSKLPDYLACFPCGAIERELTLIRADK